MKKKQLKKWFELINFVMFDGDLPEPIFWLMSKKHAKRIFPYPIDGVCVPHKTGYWIGIDRDLKGRDIFETLLHETIHIWQMETGKNAGHGKDFVRQCQRGVEFFFPEMLP